MSNQTLNRMLDDFYPYAKDYLGFDKDAKISFASDKNNASKPLGKTAYYDPSNYSVTVYTDNRHPKDIMRSVSHELVHHAQNLRGDLSMSEDAGEGYAQNDEHLREMEREAYEKGNLCFRDWEDGIKSNMEPGTIYESRARRSKKSMNNFKTLNENFKKFLKEDWQDDPMAGVSAEDEDEMMNQLRFTVEDMLEAAPDALPFELLKLVRNQPGIEDNYSEQEIFSMIQKIALPKKQAAMQEEEEGYKDGQEVEIVGGVAAGKSGTIKEPMAGGAVIELEDGKLVKVKDEFIEKPGYSSGEPMQEDAGDSMIAKATAIFPEAEVHEDGMGGYEIALSPESVARLESDPQLQGQLSDAFGDTWEMTEDGIAVQGEMSDEERRAMYDDEHLSDLDIYQESGDKEEYNGHLWENKIDKIVDMVMKEYGDHETQAQGGMVSSTQSSDPEMDQVADIVRTIIEKGGGLHDLKQPLEAEGFDVSATSRFVIVNTTNGDIGIASAKNVELSGGEELIDTQYGQLAVGRINQGMEEGRGSDFFDSDEEKEMMKKMSNKEFYDYVTRDKHTRPNLKDEPSMGGGGPIDGMEGPFQYESGAVLYYDPKEGKYYDRSRDQYLDNEEAAKLTMENTQMKLKNVNLREKVKTSVMSKLKEMYDDDDMYGDEDPYMAGLEAEFPWMKDKKKGGKMSPADAAAAEAAAAADAAAAGEFPVPPEEEEEDPTITMREGGTMAEYGAIDAQDGNPPSKIGQGTPEYMEAYNAVLVARGEEPLPVVQPDQAYLDALQSGSMKPEDHSYNMEESEEVDFAEALRSRVLNRLQELSKGQEEMDLDDDGKIEPEDLAGLRAGKEDEDVGEEAEEEEKKEESLRDRVYRIVQETLNEEEHEDEEDKEDVEEGKDKFVYATDKKRAESEKNAKDARDAYKPKDKDEDDEEKNEGKMKYSREDDDKDEKEEVEEGKYKREDEEEKEDVEEGKYKREDEDDDKEDVEENIANSPEDFFRKLRNESREVAKQSNWNDSHRAKRSSMLNERLMNSWFNKSK